MSRTLEPNISLLTACEIRVVVLPIGPMPRDTFKGYLDVFNAHRHVPLNATRSFYQGGPKSPFSHLPYKTGAMHFRFIQADEGRRRTRITDLHQQRQVIAVLGLLHCPLVEDIMAAHSEFGRASRQWPEALVARCCAFEPSSAHLSTPGCQKLPDLMIFPGGHVHQHLEVYMHEFAAAVLAAIEDFLLSASVMNVKLNTYVDSGDFLGSMAQLEEGLRKLNINEEELKEKKRWGRFQKLKGDWALLAGSPRDAFEHYKSAMELSRASADAIWYGAAVEGLAHARVLEALITARQPPAAAAAAAAVQAAATKLPPIAITAAGMSGTADGSSSGSNTSITNPLDMMTAAPPPVVAADADAPVAAAGIVQAAVAPSSHAAESASEDNQLTVADPAAAAAADAQPPAVSPDSTKAHTAAGSSSKDAGGIFKPSSKDLEPTYPGAAAAAAACEGASPTAAAAAEALEQASAAAAAASMGTDLNPIAAAAAGDARHEPALHVPAVDDMIIATAAAVATPLTPVGNSSRPATATSKTAAAATAGAHQVLSGYALSGPGAWCVLSQSGLEGEVRELLAEARNWYKKKGGALVLQIEQALKLSRFVAGVRGAAAARKEASDAAGLVLDNLAALTLPEDRLIALIEAGQVLGLAGCGRKRLLLLLSALDMFRSSGSSSSSSSSGASGIDKAAAAAAAPPSDAAAMLKLALRSLSPPDLPQQQDADDLSRVHWSMLRFIAWQQQHMSQQHTAAAHTSSSGKAPAPGSSSSHRRRASISATPAAAAAGSQQQQQRQQFYQLLGPQLQLLSPAQAAVYLQRLGGCCDSSPGSNPADSSFDDPRNQPSSSSGGSSGQGVAMQGGAVSAAGFDVMCVWGSVLVCVLEAVVNVSKVANAPIEAWEAAATLLRECYSLLPQALQVLLLETCAAAAAAMGSRARNRPGLGPGPQVQLKRVIPGSLSLQPIHLAAADMQPSSTAAAAAAASGGSSGGVLRRSDTSSSSIHGPFIFNPYAAKRKGASAAAAAEAALPEWVCGTEGHVEVLLVNPCATPLKLDQLQLVVQPLLPTNSTQQQQQQQQQIMDGSSSSSSGGSVAVVRSVSVSLPAGSKPVRVVLSYMPLRPGLAAVTGIQASCWGVNWFQPFVLLPRLAAAAAAGGGGGGGVGEEGVVPQGCFTVVVQPQLPLIKAVLQGPEVQLVQPADEELAGLLPAAAAPSSSSSTAAWLAAAAASGGSSSTTLAATGTAAAAVAAAADLDKKVTNVFVFEGQTLSWTLNLTNISDQPVTGCKVVVLNAKGSVIKPLNPHSLSPTAAQHQQQQQQLPASFSGAHMEVSESGLSAGLPLLPGSSMLLPVTVCVGRPPGDAFDAVRLQIRITYYGSSTSLTPTGSSSSSSSSDVEVLGRRLLLPLKLSIQPTLQVTGVKFLQQTVPLRDGLPLTPPHTRCCPATTTRIRQQHTHRDKTPPTATAAAVGVGSEWAAGPGVGSDSRGAVAGLSDHKDNKNNIVSNIDNSPLDSPNSAVIRRQQSRHVRNSSEGAVPVLSAGIDVNSMIALAGTSSSSRGSSPTYRRNLSPVRTSTRHVGFQGLAAAAAAVDAEGLGQQQVAADTAEASAAAAAAAEQMGRIELATLGAVAGQSSLDGSSSSGVLSVGSAPVLELAVRNASERYFRAWLGCGPDHLTAESALSAVVVLEPGDTQKLTALLPAPATAAAAAGVQGNSPRAAALSVQGNSPTARATAASAAGGVQGNSVVSILCEPSRLQCAEGLVNQLVVCWEMITGAAAAAGQLPRGRVQLASVDVAANISQGAVAALWPSPLLLRVSAAPLAPPAAAAAAAGPSSSSPQLVDLLTVMKQAGQPAVVLPGLSGPLWGLQMTVGQWLPLQLDVLYSDARSSSGSGSSSSSTDAHYSTSGSEQPPPLLLQVTLSATDILAPSSSSSSSLGNPGTPSAAAAAGLAACTSWNLLGRNSNTGQGLAAATGGGGAFSGFSGCSASQGSGSGGLMDPGVFMAGCYSGLQVQVKPGVKAVHRFRALLVQPGLYQFSVADAILAGGGEPSILTGSAAPSTAATAASSSSSKAVSEKSGRVYFSQERMFVLVTA